MLAATRHALASAGLGGSTGGSVPTVFIWQADGGRGHDLAFMYRPVMDTLVAGFTDVPPEVLAAVGRPRVIHGHGMRALRQQVFDGSSPLASLGAADTFIWIGPVGSELPPWTSLNARGVRTVYYQTEPFDGCQLASASPREVWEFSWHNFDACAPLLVSGVTMRYVPLGFSRPPPAPAQSDRAPTPPTAELVFFGYPFYRSGRGACYERLRRSLGERLNATWSVWTAADFEGWWERMGRHVAHLNLHKGCENGHNPVVFRTALLLSRGALILSEHSHARDEAEYDGLVRFGTVKQIPTMLDELAGTPRIRPEIARAFARRFAPRRIFERAAVYASLLLKNTTVDAAAGAVRIGDQERTKGREAKGGGKGGGGKGGGGKGGGGKGGGGKGGGKGGGAKGGGGKGGGKGGGRGGTQPSTAPPTRERETKHWVSSAPATSARFALLLHGRLGTLAAAPSLTLMGTARVSPADYLRPIAASAASHIEHVVRANAGNGADAGDGANARSAASAASAASARSAADGDGVASGQLGGGGVDVFAHTWNPEIAPLFDAAYTPHLRASLHQTVVYVDRDKPRSQALSIGRAAILMHTHERERRRPYELCLVLRADLLVGAPIDIRSFDPSHVWFAEHCCLNDAVDETAQALVRTQCAAEGTASAPPSFKKRLLGPCRVSQYGGQWGLQHQLQDYYYFLMDWWFVARPEVVRSWGGISDNWAFYRKRLQRLRIARWFSHYVWAIHVHDALNMSNSVRFRSGVRVNLIRSAFSRLQMRADRTTPLGEFASDAVGNCDTLIAAGTNATLASPELMQTPVHADTALGRLFHGVAPRYAPMAEQCAVARLPQPVVCCGSPRHCGRHVCQPSMAEANLRFFTVAKQATAALQLQLAKAGKRLPRRGAAGT